MSRFINGPINCVRLQNDSKVLYLYMDYHEDIQLQTVCKSVWATDFKVYLRDTFKDIAGKGKKYDFMLEVDPVWAQDTPHYFRGRYADEIDKFVKNVFNIDLENKVVYKSDIFPDVNLHLVDIRSFILMDALDVCMEVVNNVNRMWLDMNTSTELVEDSLEKLDYINNVCTVLYSNLYTDNVNSDSDMLNNIRMFIVNKITDCYKKNNVKDAVHDILNNSIKKSFHELFEIFSILQKGLEKIKIVSEQPQDKLYNHKISEVTYGTPSYVTRNNIEFIVKHIDKFYNCLLSKISSKLMDLYVIRMVMEKDSMTNCLMYTGIEHSVNMVYIFVKYFNFKITHYSYLSKPVEEVESILKNSKEYGGFSEIFFPRTLNQCSDLSSFPDSLE